MDGCTSCRIAPGGGTCIAPGGQVGQVVESNYEDGEVARFKVRIPPHFHHEFKAYLVRELQTA